jgi:hypothetical protein
MAMVHINWLAVLVSGVVVMIFGSLWYSPILFGRIWMKIRGVTEADIQKAKQKNMFGSYLIAFIGTLLMSYVLAHIIAFAGASTFAEGAMGGFWTWLGFIVPVLIGNVLWEDEPVKLYILNIAYYLVVLALIGGVLAAWK